jgi:hypothetical protein
MPVQENLNQLRSPMPVAGEPKSAKVTYACTREPKSAKVTYACAGEPKSAKVTYACGRRT